MVILIFVNISKVSNKFNSQFLHEYAGYLSLHKVWVTLKVNTLSLKIYYVHHKLSADDLMIMQHTIRALSTILNTVQMILTRICICKTR